MVGILRSLQTVLFLLAVLGRKFFFLLMVIELFPLEFKPSISLMAEKTDCSITAALLLS